MMNKWVAMRDAGNAPKIRREKRPHLASECSSLPDAERFRRQLLREISDLIAKIQNPGLGEHVIRDTNDEINKKMREKHHWNKRIKELGGQDFSSTRVETTIRERDKRRERNLGIRWISLLWSSQGSTWSQRVVRKTATVEAEEEASRRHLQADYSRLLWVARRGGWCVVGTGAES